MKGFLEKTGLTIPQVVFLSIVLMLAIVSFWGGLNNLVIRWTQREEYSHGFFIPLISLMFLWHRRDALLKSIGSPSWIGILLVICSILLLITGELSALFILIHGGFVLLLLGLVLVIGGWTLLKVSLLPLVFLIFAIPMPYFIDAQLTWGLQIISSKLGTDILRLLGVSVYLEGNVISLANYQLQVVEACSGLNYLYPLLSLGFLASYLFSAPLWQRSIIFLSTIPITVFMNSFRIAVIGVLVDLYGIEMAEGFLHFFEGWVIFMGCGILLLAEIWLFDRLGSKRRLGDLLVVPVVSPAVRKSFNNKSFINNRSVLLFIIMGIFMAISMIVLNIGDREEKQVDRKQLSSFPLEIGKWRAREDYLPSIVENKLKVDDYLLADYYHSNKEWVNFYVAYYATQRKGASPHSPRVCIPGGGWLISDIREVILDFPGVEPFQVNRIVIERNDQKQIGYYWFEQRGRRIANEYMMKWHLLVDSLLMNRTDGALVRVMTTASNEQDDAIIDERLKNFISQSIEHLSNFIPGK